MVSMEEKPYRAPGPVHEAGCFAQVCSVFKAADLQGGASRGIFWEGVKTYVLLLLLPTKKCEFRLTNC